MVNFSAKEWLAPTRMFIGLDLSHAGPQSLYERQSGQPVNDPTVVGVSVLRAIASILFNNECLDGVHLW